MSDTKHTPGPWETCDPEDYGDYDGNCRVILGDDLRVAVVLGVDGENEANAHLIAAAPDLLEALHECAEYFDRFADAEFTQDGPNPNREMTLLQSVTRAIDKAEGR